MFLSIIMNSANSQNYRISVPTHAMHATTLTDLPDDVILYIMELAFISTSNDRTCSPSQPYNVISKHFSRLLSMDALVNMVTKCDGSLNDAFIKAAGADKMDVCLHIINNMEANMDVRSYTVALTQAAENGHTNMCRFLLDYCGRDIVVDMSSRKTAILRATTNGHEDVVRMFINETNCNIYGILHDIFLESARSGHINICALVQYRFPRKREKHNALKAAAANGHLDMCHYLVSCGALANGRQSSILKIAAENGHLDVCKFLLDPFQVGGKDKVAQLDAHNYIAIRVAMRNNHTHLWTTLIEEHIPLDIRSQSWEYNTNDVSIAKKRQLDLVDNEEQVMGECFKNKHPRLNDNLDKDDSLSLIKAAYAGNLGRCITLISKGVKSSMALMYAARKGHLHACETLIKAKSDVNCNLYDSNKKCIVSPIIEAAGNGFEQLCWFLLRSGANPSMHDNLALVHAAKNGHTAVCSILLDSEVIGGADISSINNQKSKNLHPLVMAAMHGHSDVCRLLIQKGVHVNFDAISASVSRGHIDTFDILWDRRHHPITDNVSKIILMRAYNSGSEKMLRHMFTKGVCTSSHSTTNVAVMAAKDGSTNMLLMLLDPLVTGPDYVADLYSSPILRIAAEYGHLHICKLIIGIMQDQGPVAHVKRNIVCTGSLYAVRNEDIFKLFLNIFKFSKCQLVNIFIEAAKYGNIEICRLLIRDHGISPNAHGSAALVNAVSYQKIELSRLLMDPIFAGGDDKVARCDMTNAFKPLSKAFESSNSAKFNVVLPLLLTNCLANLKNGPSL